MKSEIFDLETFPNCFTYVGYNYQDNKYFKFVLFDNLKGDGYSMFKLQDVYDDTPSNEHLKERKKIFLSKESRNEDSINDMEKLLEHISDPEKVFFGFNNLKFDAPLLEYIIENKGKVSPQELYYLAQDIINDEYYLPQYKFKTKHIDLYTMWSYNTMQRRSSLKHLEFSMRMPKIKDLPFTHNKLITKSNVPKIVSYNKVDVKNTTKIFEMSEDKLELRKIPYQKYKKWGLLSRGDTALGKDTFLYDLADEMNMPWYILKKKQTHYKEINLKDVILEDRFLFQDPKFKSLVEKYKNKTVYYDEEKERINLKGAVNESIDFGGVEFNYGLGGLHASHSNKQFVADEDYLIVDVDVASFYPNLAIVNQLHPKHLSTYFVNLYKKLYDKRKEYPKSTHKLLNLAYKLRLNALFGYSNSPYSFMYDSAFTLGITINGQLQLTMLAEQLNRCSQLIQVNTDGVTVMVHKDNLTKVNKVIDWWEKKTDLTLELENYSKMSILDVNNYHAIYKNGKVKRKGRLAIYEDYEKNEDFHKNPSNLIIPKAINNFLTEGTPVSDTIYSEKNIHEFVAGFKGKRNFVFGVLTPDDKGYVDIDINTDRLIRFYVSNDGSSLYKITNKMGTTAINKGQTITVAQDLRNDTVKRRTDLNKEWYIQEAQEILDFFDKVNNEEFCKKELI